jgi:PAS domain S-box-containing protein
MTSKEPGHDAYRELFERSADAILIIEGDKFVDCNQAAVDMLRHRSREDVLRTHPSELSPATQPDGRDSFEKANELIARAFEEGSQRFEWDHLRADGEAFPVEVLLTAVQEEGRRVLHVVWRDIAERKALAEQLRQAQKMEAIGKLAGGIAHDFNNLLVVILGNAELLTDAVADDSAAVEQLDHIREAGNRAATLVQRLLAFGRKQQILPRVLDLNQVVPAASKLLKPLLGDRIELRLRVCDDPLHVKVDEGQLEQILLNLAANARDAMPGEGKFTVETRALHLSESHAGMSEPLPPGDYALLALTDTGAGMTPDTVAHAFDPFFTTKDIGKGTGLGLSTVYGIVSQGGGAINILSTPEVGTTIKIYLPITTEAPSRPRRPTTKVSQAVGTETILVAEDEPAVSALIVRTLESKGYRVLTAADGLEAVTLYREHPEEISLIVTDVMMPRMTGVEMVADLGGDGHHPPVLFVSGYTNNALAELTELDGEIDLVEKPFSPADLVGRVRAALDRPLPR